MKVNPEVIEVLRRLSFDGNTAKIDRELSPAMYKSVNQVLTSVGGKWNSGRRVHVFEGDAREAIGPVIATQQTTTRQEIGFFPTPNSVAARVGNLADVTPGMTVLEPSAGRGALVQAASQHGALVDCVELMETNIAQLRQSAFAQRILQADFLMVDPEPGALYDRVVMNPPFEGDMGIAHVRHALSFLKPGGRLVSVMPGGITSNSTKAANEFRNIVQAGEGHFEEVENGAFLESGTGVSTVIVVIDKTPALANRVLSTQERQLFDEPLYVSSASVESNATSPDIERGHDGTQYKIVKTDDQRWQIHARDNNLKIWQEVAEPVEDHEVARFALDQLLGKVIEAERTADADEKLYRLKELVDMPTLLAGYGDDLKVDADGKRVWLSRATTEDGAPENHLVTVETFRDGRWTTEAEYPAITNDAELLQLRKVSVPLPHLGRNQLLLLDLGTVPSFFKVDMTPDAPGAAVVIRPRSLSALKHIQAMATRRSIEVKLNSQAMTRDNDVVTGMPVDVDIKTTPLTSVKGNLAPVSYCVIDGVNDVSLRAETSAEVRLNNCKGSLTIVDDKQKPIARFEGPFTDFQVVWSMEFGAYAAGACAKADVHADFLDVSSLEIKRLEIERLEQRPEIRPARTPDFDGLFSL